MHLAGDAVADAGGGGDNRRFAQLAAQPPDGDRDGVGERIGLLVPDLLEQGFGAQEGRARAQQRLEHPEFLDRQIERTSVPDGRPAQRYFVNVASFGVSGQVDREVNRASKGLGGKATFFLASAKAMWRYRDQRVRLRADAGPWTEETVTTVAVANGQYFGGGMRVAPTADPSDGYFDVTVWSGYTLFDFAFKSRRIYDGTHVALPGTRTFRARLLEAESDEEVLLDVDGEQPGRLPVRVELLPGALRLKA